MSIEIASNQIDRGNYKLALKEIENFDSEDQLEGEVLKASILEVLENYREADKIVENAIADCRSTKNYSILVKALITKAKISMSDGYDNILVLKYIQEADNIIQDFDLKSSLKRYYAELISMKATISWRSGDLESSHANMTKSWLLRQELGNIFDQAKSLTAFGSYCYSIGDLDSSLNYYAESMKLLNLLEHDGYIGHNLCNVGRVHFRMGEFEKARNYYLESLEIFNTLKIYSKISWVIYELIQLLLDLDEKENAQKYLEQLIPIANKYPTDKWIQSIQLISTGLIHNSSNRMRDKAKAQEIFTDIIQESLDYHEFFFLAIKQLCSINMFELKANEDLEVLKETIELVDKLQNRGRTEYMHPIVIEAMILHSKLNLIEGNLSEATNHLQQAKQVAKKKNLPIYLSKVEELELEMKIQYETWEKMIQNNRPIGERIAKSELLNYFERAQGLIDKYKRN